MVKAFMGYDESVSVEVDIDDEAFWVKWMTF